MGERKYSVSELHDLRIVVGHKWVWGAYNPQPAPGGSGLSRSYNAAEKATAVEEMVRTHMLAGHTAEDLIASEKPLKDEQTI
jgi:hypothetical protein